MEETYVDRIKEIAYDCFGKKPEPIYQRAKEALNFAALSLWAL